MTILILLMEDMWDLIKPEKQVYPTICDGICLCIVGWLADFLHQKYCHFWSSRLLNNKNHLTESIQQEILDLHMTMKLMAYPVYIYIYQCIFTYLYIFILLYLWVLLHVLFTFICSTSNFKWLQTIFLVPLYDFPTFSCGLIPGSTTSESLQDDLLWHLGYADQYTSLKCSWRVA